MTNLITRTELETLVSSQSVVLVDALGISPSSFQTMETPTNPGRFILPKRIAVDEDTDVLVPGLGCDPMERNAGEYCRRRVAGAHGVGGDLGAVEPSGFGRARSIRAETCPVSA